MAEMKAVDKHPGIKVLSLAKCDAVSGGSVSSFIGAAGKAIGTIIAENPHTLDLGSQSSGAGAGKVTFNPF